MQATLNVLYKTIKTKKKKERFETILEPLQALLQIAYLTFTPIFIASFIMFIVMS